MSGAFQGRKDGCSSEGCIPVLFVLVLLAWIGMAVFR